VRVLARSLIRVAHVVSLSVLASCARPAGQRATPPPATSSAKTFLSVPLRATMAARVDGARALPAGVRRDAADAAIGSAIVGVFSHGETAFLGVGPRSSGRDVVDSNTVFRVCSITKVFTAVLLADAIVRGRMKLSDEAQSHSSRLTLPRHVDGTIRLEHLATYTSGFPWQPTNFVEKGYTDDAWRAFIEGYSLPQAPGREYQYGNVGFALLGDLLAEDAHLSVRDLFQKRLFDPLGMRRSRFIGERPDDENRAAGVDKDGKLVPFDISEPSQPAACAVETTASDLLAFARASLAETGPLSGAMKLALQRRRAANGIHAGSDVALGWLLSSDGRTAFKTGAIEGYRSAIALDLQSRNAVVVLSADERTDTTMLFEAVLGDLRRADEGRDSPLVSGLPSTATPLDVPFEDGLRLVGIEAPAEAVIGQEALVRYFYRVDRTPSAEWRAFVHADAPKERVRSDHELVIPMRALVAGSLVEDRVKLTFGPELKNRSFTLFNGFYRGSTRMNCDPPTADQRVRGPKIRIVSSDGGAALAP
jgi:CubicO group peptidase (beta-lactamase class C family)